MRATRVIRTLTAALVVSALAAAPATADPVDLPEIPTEDHESGTVEDPLLTVRVSGGHHGDAYETFNYTSGPIDSLYSEGRGLSMNCGHPTLGVALVCDNLQEFELDVVVADRDTSEGRLRTSARVELDGQELVDHDEKTQLQCSQSAVNGAVCDAVALVDGTILTVPLPTPLLWPLVEEALPLLDDAQEMLDLAVEVVGSVVYDALVLVSGLFAEVPQP